MDNDIPLRLPVNSLVSYHYFKNVDIKEMQDWGLRLIGDSGAFSAFSKGVDITIDEFADWGHQWKDNLAWIASLDVIGDLKASYENYQKLRDKNLDVIPTVHYGAEPNALDVYAKDGVDFVGLGGMVARKSERSKLLRWTLNMFRYARDNHPDMKFHGWGISHPELIMNLPWYSVDSSGYSSAYRFAVLKLFDPRKGKSVLIDLDGKDIFTHSDLVRRVYNIDPDLVKVSTPQTRRMLVRLAIASVQKQEDFLRKRHGFIDAPKYGVNDGVADTSIHLPLGGAGAQSTKSLNPTDKPARTLTGTNIHFVDGSKQNLKDALGIGMHMAFASTKDIKIAGGQI